MACRACNKTQGFAIVFVVGMLALLSILAVAFVSSQQLESSLGRTFSLKVAAHLAAESGLERILASIEEQCPGGPIEEDVLKSWGYDFANPGAPGMRDPALRIARIGNRENAAADVSGSLPSFAGQSSQCTVRISDESGKLNLNDPNLVQSVVGDDPYGFGNGRLYGIVSILADLLLHDEDGNEAGAAAHVAGTLLLDETIGRAAYPQDRFPSMDAVDQALRSAGLTELDIRRFHDYVTLDSWQDPDVIRPTLEIYGQASQETLWYEAGGAEYPAVYPCVQVRRDSNGNVLPIPDSGQPLPKMTDVLGLPVATNLAIQSRRWEKEPRAPVNINTARLELIQALIQPLQGVFLEEGPAETQSSEHYGWWSTGLGAPDPNLFNMGRLRLTPLFTESQAECLAQAIYDRVHGVPNSDLQNGEQEVILDEAGVDVIGVYPNPFETWEEFRQFLETGLRNTYGDSQSPYRFVWIGGGYV